jgi:hypothetical protein
MLSNMVRQYNMFDNNHKITNLAGATCDFLDNLSDYLEARTGVRTRRSNVLTRSTTHYYGNVRPVAPSSMVVDVSRNRRKRRDTSNDAFFDTVIPLMLNR